jgi:hypothetical protein
MLATVMPAPADVGLNPNVKKLSFITDESFRLHTGIK